MATTDPTDRGPWRILILDSSDPDDPRWILTAVTLPADVRSAVMEPGGRRYADWPAVTEWVRGRVGPGVRLVPVSATVWRIDTEGGAE